MLIRNHNASVSARPGPTAAGGRWSELPPWLWLWFPLCSFVVIVSAHSVDPEFYARWIRGEGGLVENGTALAAFAAMAAGILALRYRRYLPSRWVKAWVLLLTVGCFYFGAEEISWGQQWFEWPTPGWIAAVNDQDETNLHNTSGLFDQLPRNLLTLWVVIGGIAAPLWSRLRGDGASRSSDRLAMFWPTYVCLPTAVFAIAIRIPDYLQRLSLLPPVAVEIDYGEVKEFFYALFLLVYLVSLHVRLRRQDGRP